MFGRFTGGAKGPEDSGPALGVVVLRDSRAIDEAVREALAGASDEDRPGLERAAALIAARAARPESEIRGEWVRGIVAAQGVDLHAQELQAIRVLRKAQPRLGLAEAVHLVREAAATDPQ
ncbi:hypothetical protein AB0F13_03400 [Streptomyces sp. NPDC026206]|uniref:hypothetical protein n=1 Tax=Streptomyces sp. NPDC026206 TaxID=3157089 RepID=UPI0033DE61B4